MISNEYGAITSAIMMAGAALVVGYGIFKYSEQVSQSRSSAANEGYARLNNDVVTSRLGHAIGSNAILCSELDRTCRWNDNFKTADFNLESVKQDGKLLKVVARNCLPANTDSMDLSNCKDVFAEATVRMVDFQELQDAKLIAGIQKSGDKDSFGALVSVATGFNSGQSKEQEALMGKKSVTTTSLVRRPRAILRIIAGEAICSNTCEVFSAAGGSADNNFCYGPVEIENEKGRTAVKIAVVNDGPGHIYRFKVKRDFTPNRNFEGNVTALKSEIVFDSGTQLAKGLAPGEKFEFIDEKIPCFDEKITNVVEVAEGEEGTIVTQDSRNSKPSGQASYTFVDSTIEPNNALLLQADGTTVPSTSTTTSVVTVVTVDNAGMN